MPELLTGAVVVGIWLSVIVLVSWGFRRLHASSIGWTALARQYRSSAPREGIVLSDLAMVNRFAIQGRQGLNLAMVLAKDGVAVRVAGLSLPGFRQFRESVFPPLFLPWAELALVEHQFVAFGEFHLVRFASVPVEWRLDGFSGPTLLAGWKHSRGLGPEPPRGVPVPW